MMDNFDHPAKEQILDYLRQRRQLTEHNKQLIIVLLRENFGLTARERCQAIPEAQEAQRAAG